MTDNPKPQQAEHSLHPAYQPAETDTQIVIRFMGNTARVAGFGFQGQIDPFQVRAAAWWLERQAELMIATQERMAADEAARKSILTTGKLPPSGFMPPGEVFKGGPG